MGKGAKGAGPGTIGKKIWEIMELYKDKPVNICGHIKNYTSHRLFYNGVQTFEGKVTKEPEGIIWQGSEFIFKAGNIPGIFDFDKVKLSFELSFVVENRSEWGTLRIGIFDRCIGYVAWNTYTDSAREARRNDTGCSGGVKNGICIIQDESVLGHPSWELRDATHAGYKHTIERIMYIDQNGQEKEIRAGNVRQHFESAMANGTEVEITKGFLSGIQMKSGYVDYECQGCVPPRQRRSFQYGASIDFAFTIWRIEYGRNQWKIMDSDREAFTKLYASADNFGGSVKISNDLFGGKDPEPYKEKEIIVRCNYRVSNGEQRAFVYRTKENQALSLSGVPDIYNK